MTEYEGGCVERVNHFLKVFAFAKTIAEGEDVDDAIAKCSSSETEGERQTRAAEEARKVAAEKRDPEQDMRGVVNLLRDLSLTGGLAADQPEGRGGRHGQGGRPGRGGMPGYGSDWRTFSEN